jgi:hypothetical protein
LKTQIKKLTIEMIFDNIRRFENHTGVNEPVLSLGQRMLSWLYARAYVKYTGL